MPAGRVRIPGILLLLALLVPMPAGAQYGTQPAQPPMGAPPGAMERFAGQWRCQIANRSVTGNRFENYMFDYAMLLHPNGTFQAQGVYMAETNGFNDPFQAQGQWQTNGTTLIGQGQAIKQTGNLSFLFLLNDDGTGNLAYRNQTPNGLIAMACRR
ncbi:hypothetical protein M0638_11245 [Roseomonas sp. NAR14]|uniref:DUF1579 domain-containing protein n=1 Tax=Roseomonas acroporae TaxID=2937791 RepID=A0A9X1Y8D2_9PROT|nr:hypothetical protein [Roseomonas acroporae]MCK8784957.1 hypothetical protein [Roseomonas acroporae]